MTSRKNESFPKNMYSRPQSRLNSPIRCESTNEGCPVMEESGTVCGETNSLDIFQEFRQVYDDCLKKLEESQDGNATLRKLAPFKKLIDDLWEQNTMLVETVEELEQEAACKVTKLQDRLNNSCQKICEYKEDLSSLVLIIQNFFETGVFNAAGFKFNTICPASVFGTYANSSCDLYPMEERDSEMFCGKIPNAMKNSPSQTNCERMKCVVCVNNPLEVYTSKESPCYIRKSVNNNFSVQFLNQNAPNPLTESLTFEEEHSFKKCVSRDNYVEESDSQDYAEPININFSIAKSKTLDNSNCYCDCSCYASS